MNISCYFPLQEVLLSPLNNISVLTNLASQQIPWQALMRSWHTDGKENTKNEKVLFAAFSCLFLWQRRWRDLSWERVSPPKPPGRIWVLSVLPRERLWPSGSCAPLRGTWAMQRVVVNGNKLQNWKFAKVKPRQLHQGNSMVFPREKQSVTIQQHCQTYKAEAWG